MLLLAALAIVGQLIFAASALLLPIWSEYGLIDDNISQADLSSLSATGTIHIGISIVSFLSVIVGMLVLTRTVARDERWRLFPRWAVLFPAGALVLMVLQTQGPLVGLMQRLLVAMISAWLILVALEIRSMATVPSEEAAR
jgi:hypothetical protein